MPKINLTDRLKDIKVPALVIVGEQDVGTPPAMAQAIHENLPGSDLVVIPSASHISNVEQPEAFNARTDDVLRPDQGLRPAASGQRQRIVD